MRPKKASLIFCGEEREQREGGREGGREGEKKKDTACVCEREQRHSADSAQARARVVQKMGSADRLPHHARGVECADLRWRG
eukprot:3124093-Rhodomonas_salina.1